MARLVFGMNQSLDGYVDHIAFAPSPTLFRHFIEEAEGRRAVCTVAKCMRSCVTGTTIILNGMQRNAPSRRRGGPSRNGLSPLGKSVGPNARLVEDDLEGAIRALKAERDGEIEVAGPHLAHSLTELGLIHEYRIYLHPVVLGHGKPISPGPGHRSALRRVIGWARM